MNPFVANAKLQMSFRNLYRRSRNRRSDSAIAIACAMTALLVINIWSIFLIVVMVTRTSLIGKHYLAAGPYSLTLALLFLLELALVKIVQGKVVNDPMFSKQVAATSPAVSIWYFGVSVGLLIASSLGMMLTT